jgi:hypothetical protein
VFGEDSSVRRPKKYINTGINVKKSPPQSEKSPTKEKINFIKKVLRRAPFKSAKIAGFKFSILTNVLGDDFSSPPAGEIYLK